MMQRNLIPTADEAHTVFAIEIVALRVRQLSAILIVDMQGEMEETVVLIGAERIAFYLLADRKIARRRSAFVVIGHDNGIDQAEQTGDIHITQIVSGSIRMIRVVWIVVCMQVLLNAGTQVA